VEALAELEPGTPCKRATACRGRADGVRLGHHLRSHAAQAGLLSDDPERLRRSLDVFGGLAAGAECIDWTLRRPCEKTVELEVTIRLSPPISAPAP
jgi:hypothetical protein